MEVLCLMGLHPNGYEEEIEKNTIFGMQTAANKFQWGIIKGITDNQDINVTILNSLYIGSYPKRYRKIRIPTFRFQHTKGAYDINVGFTNLTGYKALSRYLGIRKEINNWIKKNNGKSLAIIAYAMATPFVEILNYVKRFYPHVKCCLVVPDLPEYMNVSRFQNRIYTKLKTLQCSHYRNKLKPIDGYIFLTDAMREWFDWNVKYTVVEGISLKMEKDLNSKPIKKEKKILYAGMIEAKYGVIDLLYAFKKINRPEWQLHIYGNGTSYKDAEKIAMDDNRIILHGQVSNSEVLEAQATSEILVNPRNDDNEFTKYSFPSKVIEYLGSGTPMIGYILPGMPEEYYDKFYVVPKNKNGLRTCLEKVMDLSQEERAQMGHNALQFIIKEKNALAQGEKIVNFIMKL